MPTTAYPWLARSAASSLYSATEGPSPGISTTTGGLLPSSGAPAIEFVRTALLSWKRTLAGPLTLLAASAHVFGRYGAVAAEFPFAVGYQIHTAISRGPPSLAKGSTRAASVSASPTPPTAEGPVGSAS